MTLHSLQPAGHSRFPFFMITLTSVGFVEDFLDALVVRDAWARRCRRSWWRCGSADDVASRHTSGARDVPV